MLLWGLAVLHVMPCEPFLEAACWQLTHVPLSRLPSKVQLCCCCVLGCWECILLKVSVLGWTVQAAGSLG